MIKINNVEITDEDFRELAEKQGFVKKATPAKRWRASLGEHYYAFWLNGKPRKLVEDELDADNGAYDSGEYFRTPEEAESYMAIKLATQRVIDRLRELDDGQKIDWNNFAQEKYYAYFDRGSKKLVVGRSCFVQTTEVNKHSAKQESWPQIIKEMPDDVKLMLGVRYE